MSRTEIIERLLEAQRTYAQAIVSDIECYGTFVNYCIMKNLEIGMCLYLRECEPDYATIIKELAKDKISDSISLCFWYPTVRGCLSVQEAKELALTPRLNHIARTINRLCDELRELNPINPIKV